MEGYQFVGTPPQVAAHATQSDEACQLPSPITSDELNDSSFDEGDSGDSSGVYTGSDPASEGVDPLDRDAATREILRVLTQWPEISIELLEWARIFIEEHPEMLTRSSTIVEAHPDREKAHAELYRGVSAICRIITDVRLRTVRDWATQLEQEWQEALGKGNEEVRYHEYIDLVYSEAERIVEKGQGVFMDDGGIEIVGEVFGFLRKAVGEEKGEHDVGVKAEDAMNAEECGSEQ